MPEIKKGLSEWLELEQVRGWVLSPVGPTLGQNTGQDLRWWEEGGLGLGFLIQDWWAWLHELPVLGGAGRGGRPAERPPVQFPLSAVPSLHRVWHEGWPCSWVEVGERSGYGQTQKLSVF